MAGGLGHVYPPENIPLVGAIAADGGDHGAVISEMPPWSKPKPGNFPQRNRLIAALSRATLVIEAPQRSGSLITARQAGELGREVLALPGPVNSRASQGCHDLIRDGVTLIRHVDDVFEALGPIGQPVGGLIGVETQSDANDPPAGPDASRLGETERQVYETVQATETSIDSIVQATGLPVHKINAALTILEMNRFIRRVSGQYVIRI